MSGRTTIYIAIFCMVKNGQGIVVFFSPNWAMATFQTEPKNDQPHPNSLLKADS